MTLPLLLCALFGVVPSLAWADCPSTLTVNQRLACLNGALNTAVTRIDALEADLAAAEAGLATASANIAALEGRVDALEAGDWDAYLTDLSSVWEQVLYPYPSSYPTITLPLPLTAASVAPLPDRTRRLAPSITTSPSDTARTHRHFSQLARVGSGTLDNAIQGRRVPKPATLTAFNRVFGLDPAQMEWLCLLGELEAAVPSTPSRAPSALWVP